MKHSTICIHNTAVPTMLAAMKRSLPLFRVLAVGGLAAVAMLFGPQVRAQSTNEYIALQPACDAVGNQAFNGPVGMDFDVLEPISVTALGTFDSGRGGIQLPINVYIYDRDSMTAVLGPVTFQPGDEGTLVCAVNWMSVTPTTLNGGFHGSIVAEGYGSAQEDGNATLTGSPRLPTIDTGGGRIQFVGSSRWGYTEGQYPDTLLNSFPNCFNAGTFEFEALPGPSITAQPLSQTVMAGGNATLSVTASGTAPLSYQWLFDGTNAISGATNATLNLTGVSTNDAGTYQVAVTDANGAIAINIPANLVVGLAGSVLAYDQSTDTGGGSGTWPAGIGLSFNVVPATSISVGELGFTGTANNISSNTVVTVQLFDAATATVLGTVTFGSTDTPTAVGIFPLYLWLKPLTNSLLLGPGSYVVAQYGGTYVNGPVGVTFNTDGGAIQDAGAMWNTAPGGPGNMPTNAAGDMAYGGPTFTMTVSGAAVITTQPQAGPAVPGTNVTLSVAGGGSLPLTYQWLKNGTNISGATGSSLTLTNVSSQDTANYQVVVANSFGSVTSAVARVTVAIPPTVAIQLNPGIVINATPGLHYQVQYRDALEPASTWQLLLDIPVLASSPYTIYDPTPVSATSKRFYQAVLIP